MAKKTNLSTIASSTGYSVSTVSRVLNGKGATNRIPKEVCTKIKAEADRLGYTPNIIAKNLRMGKTQTIGLVVPYLSNPYFANIASVIIAEARNMGYTTIVSDSMESPDMERESIKALLSRKVDGLIVVPCGTEKEYLEQINERFVPIMLVDRYFEDSRLPYVVSNNFQGGLDATNILIRNGHKRIVCIQGPPAATPNKKRIEGYRKALRDARLQEYERIVGNEFSIQNGYLETKLLLNAKEKPTAIFALSNTIGLGTIKAIREAGLNIPEDISLISFDNNLYLDFTIPPITRIGQKVDEMGKLAIKLLYDCLINEKRITSQIELSPEVILRDSVAPLI